MNEPEPAGEEQRPRHFGPILASFEAICKMATGLRNDALTVADLYLGPLGGDKKDPTVAKEEYIKGSLAHRLNRYAEALAADLEEATKFVALLRSAAQQPTALNDPPPGSILAQAAKERIRRGP